MFIAERLVNTWIAGEDIHDVCKSNDPVSFYSIEENDVEVYVFEDGSSVNIYPTGVEVAHP